jgi:diguanylate cyclase (GGDEF)-like protein
MTSEMLPHQTPMQPPTAPGGPERLASLVSRGRELIYADPRGALEVAESALALARELGDPVALASALPLYAICQYHLTDYPAALKALLEAIPLLEHHNDQLELARSLNTLALVNLELGDLDEALEGFERAHTLFVALEHGHGWAATLGNIALAYDRLGNREKALEFYAQSLHRREELGDWHGVGQAMNNLAGLQIEIGEHCEREGDTDGAQHAFRTAESFTRHALEIAVRLDDARLEAMVTNNLACLHAATGERERARDDYRRALELSKGTGDRQLEAACLADLGRLDHRNADHGEAISHLETALVLFSDLGIKDQVSKTHRDLSKAYEAIQEPHRALVHFKHFHETELELRSEAAARRSQALATRFELQKVRDQAELHRLHAVELWELNTQLHQQAALLDRQAREDALTGLANRRSLETHLEQSFTQALESRTPLTVAMADVDHFKLVNDTFSHAIGDDVLRQIAAILLSHCRAHDLVARYGGEEFVLVFPDLPGDRAFELCERLRLAVQNHDWTRLHPELRVTMSVGFTDDVLHMVNHEQLLAIADKHLYQAKHAGRNRVRPNPRLSS